MKGGEQIDMAIIEQVKAIIIDQLGVERSVRWRLLFVDDLRADSWILLSL